jgi:hypothetical protein
MKVKLADGRELKMKECRCGSKDIMYEYTKYGYDDNGVYGHLEHGYKCDECHIKDLNNKQEDSE